MTKGRLQGLYTGGVAAKTPTRKALVGLAGSMVALVVTGTASGLSYTRPSRDQLPYQPTASKAVLAPHIL